MPYIHYICYIFPEAYLQPSPETYEFREKQLNGEKKKKKR